MIERLVYYLGFPFVRYALIVGVLVALCSSLLGVTLVLRRFSFIGDGLSHVAFGAMAVASVMKMTNEMPLTLLITMVCAVLLLRAGRRARLSGDAAVAMLSVGALAFGYLLMNIFTPSGNLSGDVCTTLFGSTSILTLTRTEVRLCIALSALMLVSFALLYNKLFAVTFDESFAAATGVDTGVWNTALALMTAVVIVLAMNLVGSLLISALVIFPSLSAMRVFRSFRAVTLFSAALSVVCALAGLLVSIVASTPVGSTIVAADVCAFAACCLWARLNKGGSLK